VKSLLPYSYVWTRFQKWLIVGTVVTALAVCGAGIYYYERHCRVTDSVFIGTWRFPPLFGDDIYFRLNADHTFRTFSRDVPEEKSMRGHWFGGGDFLYFRRPIFDPDGFLNDHPLYIWRVESISQNQLHVRLNPDGIPRTVRRVALK